MAAAACPRASRVVLRFRGRLVRGIEAAARAAAFTGTTSQHPLLTYMTFKSHLRATALKLIGPALVEKKGQEGMETIGTVHVAHWVPFENDHIGFWTVYDGDMEKYIEDFAKEISVVFDSIFPHVEGAPPTRWQRTRRRSISGLWTATIRRSGFTAPIRACRFWTSEPCWPSARHTRSPPDRTRCHMVTHGDPPGGRRWSRSRLPRGRRR